MSDRFRELEKPQAGRLKDVVLMATVSSFESLRHPRKSDLRQFAELFAPLYLSSSEEARRQAVAALSQCPHVPQSVAYFIASQPISVAAIFLTRSQAIAERTLVDIARRQTPAHRKAIARRDDLSPGIVDVLVGLDRNSASRPEGVPGTIEPLPAPVTAEKAAPAVPDAAPDEAEAGRLRREEALRNEIKALARVSAPRDPEIPVISALHEALLVRFARSGETRLLATALADAMASSPSLAERILLDVSGVQLATACRALKMDGNDSLLILRKLYPHLGEAVPGGDGASEILASLDDTQCRERLQIWLRADRYTEEGAAPHAPYLAPERKPDVRTASKSAAPLQQNARAEPRRTFGRAR